MLSSSPSAKFPKSKRREPQQLGLSKVITAEKENSGPSGAAKPSWERSIPPSSSLNLRPSHATAGKAVRSSTKTARKGCSSVAAARNFSKIIQSCASKPAPTETYVLIPVPAGSARRSRDTWTTVSSMAARTSGCFGRYRGQFTSPHSPRVQMGHAAPLGSSKGKGICQPEKSFSRCFLCINVLTSFFTALLKAGPRCFQRRPPPGAFSGLSVLWALGVLPAPSGRLNPADRARRRAGPVAKGAGKAGDRT
mmetsp:Transcript_21113/g.39680  ORF Transcript_21113/g.39680 Transcript_21113/m.39680 type:complete len:251 (-) Transcript_21113:53-805(-)